jgi:hypothetical protein
LAAPDAGSIMVTSPTVTERSVRASHSSQDPAAWRRRIGRWPWGGSDFESSHRRHEVKLIIHLYRCAVRRPEIGREDERRGTRPIWPDPTLD